MAGTGQHVAGQAVHVGHMHLGHAGQRGGQPLVEGAGHRVAQRGDGLALVAQVRQAGDVRHVEHQHALRALGHHFAAHQRAQLGAGVGDVLQRLIGVVGGSQGQLHEDVVGAGHDDDQFVAPVGTHSGQVRGHLLLHRLGQVADIDFAQALHGDRTARQHAGNARAALRINGAAGVRGDGRAGQRRAVGLQAGFGGAGGRQVQALRELLHPHLPAARVVDGPAPGAAGLRADQRDAAHAVAAHVAVRIAKGDELPETWIRSAIAATTGGQHHRGGQRCPVGLKGFHAFSVSCVSGRADAVRRGRKAPRGAFWPRHRSVPWRDGINRGGGGAPLRPPPGRSCRSTCPVPTAHRPARQRVAPPGRWR